MNLTDPTDILARTAWGEARGCGEDGMQRVLNVVMNRATNPRWWGHDPAEVCLKPWQFSCWNADDPNRPKLEAVTDADPQFRIALDLARAAAAWNLPDLTGGADSYFVKTMTPPPWTRGATHTVDDGWHSFWITRHVAHAPSAYQPREVSA